VWSTRSGPRRHGSVTTTFKAISSEYLIIRDQTANFMTHFPFRGVKTIESYGFISSSQFPGLSGMPLHVSYFKTKEAIASLISIIAILSQLDFKSAYSFPRQMRGPYPNTIVLSNNFDCSSRLRSNHLTLEGGLRDDLSGLKASGSGKIVGSLQTGNTL